MERRKTRESYGEGGRNNEVNLLHHFDWCNSCLIGLISYLVYLFALPMMLATTGIASLPELLFGNS